MNDELWSVGIGFTGKCNMNCGFCYSRKVRKENSDLGIGLWKRFLTENGEKIHSINYGTGESTMANEWFEFIRFVHASFPAITQALTTNGNLANAIGHDVHYESFVNTIDEVDISLDFADSEAHNRWRRVDDAYSMAMKSAELCGKMNKPISFVMLGTDETLEMDNLASLFRIVKAHDAFLRINLYRQVSRNGIKPPRFEVIRCAIDWIIQNHHVVSISDPLISSIYINGATPDPSGKRSLRILPQGDISPSTYLVSSDWIAGNISEYKILDQLSDRKPFQKLRHAPLPDDCIDCRFVSGCNGGTYDRRILTYGTLKERDPYCPFRFRSKFTPPNRALSFSEGPNVHGDYLPTLIFKPK